MKYVDLCLQLLLNNSICWSFSRYLCRSTSWLQWKWKEVELWHWSSSMENVQWFGRQSRKVCRCFLLFSCIQHLFVLWCYAFVLVKFVVISTQVAVEKCQRLVWLGLETVFQQKPFLKNVCSCHVKVLLCHSVLSELYLAWWGLYEPDNNKHRRTCT